MKKLYAKASFKSKKPNNKNAANQDCNDSGIYISKPQHAAIILAYQNDGSTQEEQALQQQQYQQHPADMTVNTATMRKINKRPAFVAATEPAMSNNEAESYFPAPPSRTPTSSSASPSLSASNPSLARQHTPDEAHYYYSIQELQQLNMLDHRHPHFHRQQQHQLLRQSNTATTTTSATFPSFYEHHQLVLQLPMAAAAARASSGLSDETTPPTTTPPTTTSPIYEAPQMVNNANGSIGARSLDYDYNSQPPRRSLHSAFDVAGHNFNDDTDEIDGRTAGFGSLPIVDAASVASTRLLGSSPPTSLRPLTASSSSSLSFNNLRKLQHTNSMPSIRMRNDRSDGGGGNDYNNDDCDDDDDDADADVANNVDSAGGGGLQQLHLYRLQQQILNNQQYNPRATRHNSVKVNLINNWRASSSVANGNVYVDPR